MDELLNVLKHILRAQAHAAAFDTTCKTQDLLHHFSAAVRAVLHGVEQLNVAWLLQLHAQNREGHQNRGQHIVQIMRHAAGERADALDVYKRQVLITEPWPLDEPGPRIVFVNEAFTRQTGYSREEALGRSPRFLQGPATDRSALGRMHDALAQGLPSKEELVNYKKDGTAFWVEIDIVPITDVDGRPTHFVAVERDITARKEAADRLWKSNLRYEDVYKRQLPWCRKRWENKSPSRSGITQNCHVSWRTRQPWSRSSSISSFMRGNPCRREAD